MSVCGVESWEYFKFPGLVRAVSTLYASGSLVLSVRRCCDLTVITALSSTNKGSSSSGPWAGADQEENYESIPSHLTQYWGLAQIGQHILYIIYHVIGPKNRFAVLMDILTVRRPRLKIYFIMHCNIWLWRYPWSCWDLCPDSTNTLQELCSLLIIEHSMISHCFIVRHQVKSWPISLFQSLQRNLFQY